MTIGRENLARRVMSQLGLRFATPEDIAESHAMAVRLVGPQIASLETMLRVQARSRCAAFVMRSRDGALLGAISVIPLAAGAQHALAAGDFDGLHPADAAVARPGEPAIAFYGWGMAGLNALGRASVIAAAMRFQRDVYPTLPFYARAATSEGAHVLYERMGARPLDAPGGLVVAAPWLTADQRKVA